MAYSRFIDSDIYIYSHVAGYIECCACWLNEDKPEYALFPKSIEIYNDDELIAHLDLHTQVGHNMPIDLLQDILADPDRYGAGTDD